MNLKHCKKLRRLARRAVESPARTQLINEKTKQIVNDPQSQRGVYRMLKRGLRG